MLRTEDVEAFTATVSKAVEDWWGSHRAQLETIDSKTRPQKLIEDLGDDLLEKFRGRPLISEYSVYEQLMSYWNDTMHDDVTLIVGAGWVDAAQPRDSYHCVHNKEAEVERRFVFGTEPLNVGH